MTTSVVFLSNRLKKKFKGLFDIRGQRLLLSISASQIISLLKKHYTQSTTVQSSAFSIQISTNNTSYFIATEMQLILP